VAAEDLFTPTLQEHVSHRGDARPWRLGSQVYVAFFGGPLGATAIAYFNAMLLHAPVRVKVAILAIGAAGLAAMIGLAALLLGGGSAPDGARQALTLVGLAAWGGMFLVQRPWDRIYSSFADETEDDELYESLVGPGVLVAIVGYVANGVVVSAVTA
jgi:hypothetical protein